MKPRFEKHQGQLFRMLEEPVPLTTDAKLPCLVRLIQDDSRMGRYNRDAAYFDVIGKLFVAQKIKENPFYSNTLHAYEKNSLNQDYCIASIHTLEIIGYPVAEGSCWWALYQMMQGKMVCHETSPLDWYRMYNDHAIQNRTVGYMDRVSAWLESTVQSGWQLYKEPEPKRLLADAKVGDLCQRSNGRYTQFYSKHKLNDGSIAYYFTDASGSTDIDGNHCIYECGNNIVSCEPLAPEGSAEWAWQMLMLGKTVYNPAYYSSHRLITPNMLGNCSKQSFVGRQEPSGWQLYKEPKPEPAKEQFEVGDWVEIQWDDNSITHEQIVKVRQHEFLFQPNERCCYTAIQMDTMKHESMNIRCIRRLKPQDVIVHIGCLGGTVVDAITLRDAFYLKHSDCSHSLISFTALDTQTSELVKSLLEAMQEEK